MRPLGPAPEDLRLFFAGEERGSWLNEADFLARAGPSEAAATDAVTDEEQAVVRVRMRHVAAGDVVHRGHEMLQSQTPVWRPCTAACLQRRVLIGVLGAAAIGALALVPLDSLQPKPSKPLFYYLTPLVRVEVRLLHMHTLYFSGKQFANCGCVYSGYPCAQALLTELDDIIGEGRWAGDSTAQFHSVCRHVCGPSSQVTSKCALYPCRSKAGTG